MEKKCIRYDSTEKQNRSVAQEECFKRGSSSLLIIEDTDEARFNGNKEHFWTAGKREMINGQGIKSFYWETYPSFNSPVLPYTPREFPWNENEPSNQISEDCVYFNTDRWVHL